METNETEIIVYEEYEQNKIGIQIEHQLSEEVEEFV